MNWGILKLPNQGTEGKLSLPTPQGIPVLFSKYKTRHWQKYELRAWQPKDKERENMMCNKSGTHKIIVAGHIILTLLGIVSTLMIFQHVTMLNHDDREAGSTYQMQNEQVFLWLCCYEALGFLYVGVLCYHSGRLLCRKIKKNFWSSSDTFDLHIKQESLSFLPPKLLIAVSVSEFQMGLESVL